MTYTLSAELYDRVYHLKDYFREADLLFRMIDTLGTRTYATLLDVGCGTGAHLVHLKERYTCTGVDSSEEMLQIARRKLPDVDFAQGDMRRLDLGRQFDLVTCLFSAVGYMQTIEDLRAAFANMARHVAPGGMLFVEAWFHPAQFIAGKLGMLNINEPEFKVTRIDTGKVEERLSIMEMHYLVGTPNRVDYYVENHAMGLFTHTEYMETLTATGLKAAYDPDGFIRRSLYIGVKPSL